MLHALKAEPLSVLYARMIIIGV